MGVKMSLEYRGALRCALVHVPSGTRIETDAPAGQLRARFRLCFPRGTPHL
jgi:hypothetical protein